MKRFLAILTAFALALSLAGSALAADTGTYRTLYSGEITTLNYLITATTNEFGLAANLIDTLVEYDEFGQIQPSLATDWGVSDDGLTWTFHLRDDVNWVKADGTVYAPVTANDFVFSAKYILDAQNGSSTADILYGVIAGAEAYYDGTSTPEEGAEPAPVQEWDTVGVKALDDYTLQYTLTDPTPYFLSMTTYVCFMPANEQFVTEMGENFGQATGNDTILYCGSYVLESFEPQNNRVLVRNEANWDKDRVYITRIEEKYNKEASTIGPDLYLRGEIDSVSISSEIAQEWLQDEAKADLIHPVRRTSFYSYWYSLNFDPQFDAIYEPDNWKLAVNNENFRKSLYYGLDRVKAMAVTDADNAENLLYNTITPPAFVDLSGKDYVTLDALKPITDLGASTFDKDQAIAYRDAAKEELTAAGATFPIKILMVINPNEANRSKEYEVIEQQLEGLLGNDYIDILLESGPSSGFLKEIRRSGNYAFMKVNWGPDYADPNTYSEPFWEGNSYAFMYRSEDEGTQALVKEYLDLVAAAQAITDDLEARYNAFAEAEAFLVNHALVIPCGTDNGGYTASRLDPFTSQYAPFGISMERYKGQKLLEKPMNTDEFYDALDAWEAAREALAAE